MDSASLRVEIEKNFFVLGLRFSEGGRHKWGYHFCFFLACFRPTLRGPGRHSNDLVV